MRFLTAEEFEAAHRADLAWLEDYHARREDNAYGLALALAVLTWLHGSQEPDARATNTHPDGCHTIDPMAHRDCETDGHYECATCTRNMRRPRPDARAELDAWMRAGIDGANGDTMTDAIGLQYVKTWPVLIDEVSDFVPLSPEDVARLEAPQGRKFVASAKPVNISGAFFPRPKEKP